MLVIVQNAPQSVYTDTRMLSTETIRLILVLGNPIFTSLTRSLERPEYLYGIKKYQIIAKILSAETFRIILVLDNTICTSLTR